MKPTRLPNPEITLQDISKASGLQSHRAVTKRLHSIRLHFGKSKHEPVLWSHLKQFYELPEDTLAEFREVMEKITAKDYLLS